MDAWMTRRWPLFTGYGYQPRFIEDLDDIDADVGASMEWALGEIRKIQMAARSGKPIMKPRWPVLIMRTPKVSHLDLRKGLSADLVLGLGWSEEG
jgi:phosphoketolase